MSRGLRRIAIAVGVLVVALVGAIAVREVAATNEEAIVVVHWSNSHPMREGLMPAHFCVLGRSARLHSAAMRRFASSTCVLELLASRRLETL